MQTYISNGQNKFAPGVHLLLLLACFGIEKMNLAILGTRDDVFAVWRERHSPRFHGAVVNLTNSIAGSQVPQVDGGIKRA